MINKNLHVPILLGADITVLSVQANIGFFVVNCATEERGTRVTWRQ
jgi:hypothetical protein